MGCVSSKLLVKKNVKHKVAVLGSTGDLPNHVVSLTSTTYGALKLDPNQQKQAQTQTQTQTHKNNEKHQVAKKKEDNVVSNGGGDIVIKDKVEEEELEVINTWELMEDLEEETQQSSSSNAKASIRRSPFKRLMVNQVMSTPSPKDGNNNNGTNLVGKENSRRRQQCYTTPTSRSKSGGLKKYSSNSTNNKLRKASSMSMSMEESPPRRSNASSTTRRRSLSPLFDPELIESLEKELAVENEQIKEMVMVAPTPTPTPTAPCSPKKTTTTMCNAVGVPPGGDNCVVMYTTTLRGIRKTFEECNVVRSAIESYQIRVIERDISMDSGYKEELRKLLLGRGVKVPLVFVKGKLIGGAEEIIKLEEDGKLQGLFKGIPKALPNNTCQGCGGIRFVMCMDCNGSCKLLDPLNHNLVLRCAHCNENGLIHCPICSSF